MYGLRKMLEMEEKRLSRIEKLVEESLCAAPAGSLRVSCSNGHTQYYHCTDENEKSRHFGTYIRKANLDLARKLAQKDYDRKMQELVRKRLKQIRKILPDYEDEEVERIYLEEVRGRQEMILPVEKTKEWKLKEWMDKPYQSKPFYVDAPEIYSKKGERVRSKSEKILADTFFDLGIPYKYECPLQLKDGRVVYPDFTFLNLETGKEIYWEHDGKMDDPEYASKAVRKIDSYMKSDIFPGEQLILTYETSEYMLNFSTVKALIHKYLV